MIAGIVLGIVAGLIANELCEFSPWCARKLVRWSAFRRYTDPGRAKMRAEELTRLIDDRPGNLFKLVTAVCFAVEAVVVSRRRGKLLQQLAAFAPWIEAVGFLTFAAYYLNVPLLQPWQDWLGWSFAVVIVVVIILGQTWLVRHAGHSHSHAREAFGVGQRMEAHRGYVRRNRYLWLTAVTAVPITVGMIWSGTATLGHASIGTAALMISAAAVTGLLLPILTYLGTALHDSEGLQRQLRSPTRRALNACLETTSDSRANPTEVAETGGEPKNTTYRTQARRLSKPPSSL